MTKDSTRRTIRTVFQTGVGVAAAMPQIVDASGAAPTLWGVAYLLAVSGGLSRIMALPAVDRLLPSWIRADAKVVDGK